jgi:hypothetical protein
MQFLQHQSSSVPLLDGSSLEIAEMTGDVESFGVKENWESVLLFEGFVEGVDYS